MKRNAYIACGTTVYRLEMPEATSAEVERDAKLALARYVRSRTEADWKRLLAQLEARGMWIYGGSPLFYHDVPPDRFEALPELSEGNNGPS